MDINNKSGLTLIEIIIVITLITILAAFVAPVGFDFYRRGVLERETELLKANLERARDFARTGKLDSSWGIKFYPGNGDHDCEECYIFFKGNSYDERNSAYDKIFNLPPVTVEGVSEVVFEKITGEPSIIK